MIYYAGDVIINGVEIGVFYNTGTGECCLSNDRYKVFELGDVVKSLQARFFMSAQRLDSGNMTLKLGGGRVLAEPMSYDSVRYLNYDLYAFWDNNYYGSSGNGNLTFKIIFDVNFDSLEPCRDCIELLYSFENFVILHIEGYFAWVCILYPRLLSFILKDFYMYADIDAITYKLHGFDKFNWLF